MTHKKDADSTPPLTVYYDGACPLCSIEIKHYKAQRGAEQIDFVDASAPDADLGDGLDPDRALARFHVRRGDGTLVSGAAGFATIWALLPKWRVMARLAALPGMLWIMERGYRAFLPLRPALARLIARRGTSGSVGADKTT